MVGSFILNFKDDKGLNISNHWFASLGTGIQECLMFIKNLISYDFEFIKPKIL